MPRTILYLQYTNPAAYPPLEYGARILAGRGWRCVFYGVKEKSTTTFKLPDVCGMEAEVLPAATRGWRMKFHYLKYVLGAWKRARKLRADWIYVSDTLATPAGWLLSILGYRVVYHEHDSVGKQPSSAFERVLAWTHMALARRADLIVFPQEERLRIFQQRLGSRQPACVVWNCPMKADVAPAVRPARAAAEPLCVYFHGSINLNRLPLTLIEAAGRCAFPVVLRVVGYETVGSQGVSERLRQAVAELPSGQIRMELPGSFDERSELQKQMRGAHVGWVNGLNWDTDINLKYLCGASNKPFDYLAAGLPLLVPDDPAWRRMYVAADCALPCDAKDPESIAAALRWICEHPAEAQAMGERGRQRMLSDWNYETQFQPVVEILEAKDSGK